MRRSSWRRRRADPAHPAFSNLFVQTEFVAELGGLLATRRPPARRASRPSGRLMSWPSKASPEAASQYETDRARFLGRGRAIRTPMAVIDGRPLSNTVGSVLDPIFSLRRRVRLAPGERTVRSLFSTLVAPSREQAVERWPTNTATRPASSARSPWPGPRRRSSCTISASGRTRRTCSRPWPAACSIRPDAPAARRTCSSATASGPSALWAHGISGDLPIVLVADRRGRGSRESSASSCAPTSTGV